MWVNKYICGFMLVIKLKIDIYNGIRSVRNEDN